MMEENQAIVNLSKSIEGIAGLLAESTKKTAEVAHEIEKVKLKFERMERCEIERLKQRLQLVELKLARQEHGFA